MLSLEEEEISILQILFKNTTTSQQKTHPIASPDNMTLYQKQVPDWLVRKIILRSEPKKGKRLQIIEQTKTLMIAL